MSKKTLRFSPSLTKKKTRSNGNYGLRYLSCHTITAFPLVVLADVSCRFVIERRLAKKTSGSLPKSPMTSIPDLSLFVVSCKLRIISRQPSMFTLRLGIKSSKLAGLKSVVCSTSRLTLCIRLLENFFSALMGKVYLWKYYCIINVKLSC